jgi:hypothetical protein
MVDLPDDKQILKSIIAKLYDYSITSTQMRVFISPQKTTRYPFETINFRVVMCPCKEGYRGPTTDLTKKLVLNSDSVPFVGSKEMKAHELMPIIHRIMTGEEKDGATGDWHTRYPDR